MTKAGNRVTAKRLMGSLASIALLVVIVALLQSEVTATCEGYEILEGPHTRLIIDGRKTTMTPLKNGAIFPDFFNLTLTLTNITERNPQDVVPPATIPDCNWAANADVRVVQAWDLSTFDCTVKKSSYIRSPGNILVESITINYTSVATPSLYLANTFFMTNGTFEVRPSNDTTYIDPGHEYVWKYTNGSLKWNYEIGGLPWQGLSGTKEEPNYFSSYMAIYLKWGAQVSNVNLTLYDSAYSGGFIIESLDDLNTAETAFEKSYMFDGIPFFKGDTSPSSTRSQVIAFATGDYLPLYSGVSFCTPFHYNVVTYDPTLSVLFGNPATPESRSSSSSSNAWKIAVGATLGAVLLIIIALILLAVFYTPFRNFVRPYSGRQRRHGQLDDSHPHKGASSAPQPLATQAAAHSQSGKEASSASTPQTPNALWNQAQKPLVE